MRLADLEPHWMSPVPGKPGRTKHHYGERPSDCYGLHLLCPKCFAKNGGPVGTHAVHCLTPAAPADMRPLPGRWNLVGDDFATLTLTGANSNSNSVWLKSGCKAHFFVRDGEIVMA